MHTRAAKACAPAAGGGDLGRALVAALRGAGRSNAAPLPARRARATQRGNARHRALHHQRSHGVRRGEACHGACLASLTWRKSGAHRSCARAPAACCPARAPRCHGPTALRCCAAPAMRDAAAAELRWRDAAAGAAAGVCNVLALHPLDVVKTRLQGALHSPAPGPRQLLTRLRLLSVLAPQCKTAAPLLTCIAARCTRSRPSCAPRHVSIAAAASAGA